jgi:BTB/POZ domain-containing protein 13
MGNFISRSLNSEKTKSKKRKICEVYENNAIKKTGYYSSRFSTKLNNWNSDYRVSNDVNDDDDENNNDNRIELSESINSKNLEKNLTTLMKPNKKRMKSTSSYILKTLFIDGENSDIKVRALNHEWNLHKIYLCQSPYFDSMFKGYKWKESNQTCIEIAVPDQNINLKSLDITFSSFYSEDIDIVPLESINILACASLFNLNGLINQCASVMIENLNSDSVLAFYEASLTYGLKSVEEKAFKWLCMNLMSNDSIRLSEIAINLFEKIILSPDFLIVQVETDLYSLCKKWLYFQLNKNETDKELKSQKSINDYFKSLLCGSKNISKCILENEKYSVYQPIFRKIRLQHIITDYSSLKLIYNDQIIPHNWLDRFYFTNWMSLIYIDQDKFSHEFEIDLNHFENECLRFGRLLDEKDSTWRWVSLN